MPDTVALPMWYATKFVFEFGKTENPLRVELSA